MTSDTPMRKIDKTTLTLILASILVTTKAENSENTNLAGYICGSSFNYNCSGFQSVIDSIAGSGLLTAVCNTDDRFCSIDCSAAADTCSLTGIDGLECDDTNGWCIVVTTFSPTASPTTSSPTASTIENSEPPPSNDNINIVIIVVVVGILFIICIIVAMIILSKRKKRINYKINNEQNGAEIEIATNRINSVSSLTSKDNITLSTVTAVNNDDNGTLNEIETKNEEPGTNVDAPPTENAIMSWLDTNCGLKQYFDSFVKNGYESMDLIKEIEDIKQLTEIGIELIGHRHKIWKEIKKLQETGTELHEEGIEGAISENETIPFAVNGETSGNKEINANIGDDEFVVMNDDNQ